MMVTIIAIKREITKRERNRRKPREMVMYNIFAHLN